MQCFFSSSVKHSALLHLPRMFALVFTETALLILSAVVIAGSANTEGWCVDMSIQLSWEEWEAGGLESRGCGQTPLRGAGGHS